MRARFWVILLALLAAIAIACGGTAGQSCNEPGAHRYENKDGQSKSYVCVKNNDGSSTWQ